MMIVVPYVEGMLRSRTSRTPGAEFVQIARDDRFAYWRLLRRLFESAQTFLIVEQDIYLNAEQIADVDACPEEWCVFGYPYGALGVMVALGACRLRGSIVARYPKLLRRHTPEDVPWTECDGTIFSRLQHLKVPMHRHYPNAEHDPSAQRILDDYPVTPSLPYNSEGIPA